MNGEPRTLTVTGEGVSRGAADSCLINVVLKAVSERAAEAFEQVSGLATRAIAALHGIGLDRDAIETSDIYLQEHHDRQNEGPRKHEARYGLIIKTRSVEAAGPVFSVLTEVAGDSLEINRLQMALSAGEVLKSAARDLAITDATARAEQLARGLGVSLGPVLSIEEGDHQRGGSYRMARASAASVKLSGSVPLEAGEVAAAVAVTVTYQIEDSTTK
jgi:uncharacterized protein YggE